MEDLINTLIQETKVDTNLISDGYHTFGELYEHRIINYIKLAELAAISGDSKSEPVWRATVHSDGSVWKGWFLLGINTSPGKQITYHLPMSKWDDCKFAETLNRAPEFDGHTSQEVLQRIKNL